jgi:myo-inositol-1(or 4)-monophosphatase
VTAPPRGSTADLLELATSVAVAAGRLLLGSGGRPEVVATKSSPTDVVTEADRAAETMIRELIGEARPGDRILGEEGGETAGQGRAGAGEEGSGGVGSGGVGAGAGWVGAGGAGGAGGVGAGGAGGASRVRWIVDPLDGTVNYLYGLPDWAVSIAAEADGTVVAGAVFVPRRDELFSAAIGGGAWLSSGALDWRGEDAPQPIRLACNVGVPLDHALVATGFGYEAGRRLVQGEVLRAVLPRVRDIRRGGSAAVDLCSVASGSVDAYYERGVNLWDIAAGSLIAAEAGAEVAGLHGRPAGPAMTIAAAPPLLGELHDLLASTDPERDA